MSGGTVGHDAVGGRGGRAASCDCPHTAYCGHTGLPQVAKATEGQVEPFTGDPVRIHCGRLDLSIGGDDRMKRRGPSHRVRMDAGAAPHQCRDLRGCTPRAHLGSYSNQADIGYPLARRVSSISRAISSRSAPVTSRSDVPSSACTACGSDPAKKVSSRWTAAECLAPSIEPTGW
jgi:hypothetical protein